MTSSAAATAGDSTYVLESYLNECKALVLDEIRKQIEGAAPHPDLYALMLDYPLRGGKGLRPALAIAACRAAGGALEAILPTAAVLELYHNAFLIHDDVEDESLARRGRPTLHMDHGIPIAVNVGDAMLCMSLQPLLDNTKRLGLGPSLRILEVIAHMTRRSVEGQATELRWIQNNSWQLTDDDYVDMVIAKTGWYSFIAPLQIGALAAGAPSEAMQDFELVATHLSVAFQITDDLLNLDDEADSYGKELAGDLWEGKRTLPLLHALRSATEADRSRALGILAKPRPGGKLARVRACIDDLECADRIDASVADELKAALDGTHAPKSNTDVIFLRDLISGHGGVTHAERIARVHAEKAHTALAALTWLGPSVHRDMIEAVVAYVYKRRL